MVSLNLSLQGLLEVEEVLPLRVAERRVVDVSPKVVLRRAAHCVPVRSVHFQGESKRLRFKVASGGGGGGQRYVLGLGMTLLITQILRGSFDTTHAVYARLQHSHVKG